MISVIIPCFNHGQYLDEAVDSVLAQTCQDFEILIVDDGSTEAATRELIETYDRDKTRTVRIENRGLSGARNFGIEQTSHAFICALDADDVLEPTWFERALEVFEQDEEVDFVSHWLRTFGDEQWEWTPERCDLAALLDMNTVNGAALVRRKALLEVGLFDESMRDGCEDWDLWLRMVESGKRGVIVPDFLFRYRRRADSMSRAMNRPKVQLGLFRRLIEQHRESYRLHLKDLLLRRETSICDLQGEMFDLEREHHQWWLPELERRRAELKELKAKVEAVLERRRREEKLARFEGLEADLEGHRQALGNSRSEVEGLRDLQLQSQDQCRHLQADLEGHREAMHHAEAELGELRRIETEGREELSHLAADLEGHRTALLQNQAELAEMRRLQEEAQDRARHLLLDLEGHQSALDLAHQENADLRASRSWRWTSLLRGIGDRRDRLDHRESEEEES